MRLETQVGFTFDSNNPRALHDRGPSHGFKRKLHFMGGGVCRRSV